MFSDLQVVGKVQQVFLVHIINYKFILSLVILLCFLLQAANSSVKMPVFIINNEKTRYSATGQPKQRPCPTVRH